MLELVNIHRAFDKQAVLRGVDLAVAEGEIVCIVGPSGCGKTTLLRVIAGLERLDTGDVRLDGQSIVNIPVHEREFGLMFQDFALFPHLNVEQNILFGLKMRGQPDRQQRLKETLDLVGLRGFEQRDVSQLSGGERQRVALARSLAPKPRLLMLDEPLGSLDAALRERLAIDLREIIKQVGLTALYVTHDQQEAFAIADRLVIMNAGLFEQVDTPQRVYYAPRTDFVARFLGLSNIVPVTGWNGELAQTPLGGFRVVIKPQNQLLLLHPSGIHPIREGDTIATENSITGVITACIFRGDRYQLTFKHTSNIDLTFSLPSQDTTAPEVGEAVQLMIDPQHITTLSPSPHETRNPYNR